MSPALAKKKAPDYFPIRRLSKSWLKKLASTPLAAIATAASVTPAASAIPTTATTIAATASARRTRIAGPRLIHRERPTFYRLAVELVDRVLRFLVRAHGNKGEATRFAREFVLHEHDFLDGTRLREKFLQFVFGRVEGEISDV